MKARNIQISVGCSTCKYEMFEVYDFPCNECVHCAIGEGVNEQWKIGKSE